MKKIVFITPGDAEYGFSLAGVTHHVIAGNEAEGCLRKALEEEDAGLVVMDERLVRGINEERLREMEERWYGVLLVLPAPKKAGITAEDYALRLIKKAIGYYVRLR